MPPRDADRTIVMAALSAYPPDLAGARLRIHQYQPHLAVAGVRFVAVALAARRPVPVLLGQARSHPAEDLARVRSQVGLLAILPSRAPPIVWATSRRIGDPLRPFQRPE